MSQFVIEKRPVSGLDEGLYEQLRPLVASAFVDADVVLGRAFFFSKLRPLVEPLQRGTDRIGALVDVGLSATTPCLRGSGLVAKLYRARMDEALEGQNKSGTKVLAWGRTANPTIMRNARAMLGDVAPSQDWSYRDDDATIARTLRKKAGLPLPENGEHPFVARDAFPLDRFLLGELQRMAAVRARMPEALPEDLRSEVYDQVLFFGYLREGLPRKSVAAKGDDGIDVCGAERWK
jgi:hypothetical protein